MPTQSLRQAGRTTRAWPAYPGALPIVDPRDLAELRSAVTGVSYREGVRFDQGRQPSDFDLAIVSPTLFATAQARRPQLRGQGTRTEPLSRRTEHALGLRNMATELRAKANRKLGFVIYRSGEDLFKRGPAIQLP